MTKLLLLDTETSGLYPNRNCVDQIAGFVIIDGQLKEKFNLEFRPHEDAQIEQSAYDARGINLQNVLKREDDSYQGKTKFTKILEKHVSKWDKADKLIPVGFNLNFDLSMIDAWFKRNGDKWLGSYLWRPGIDVLSLALDALQDTRHTMENFKQGTVATALGIEVDKEKLHDALCDIEIMQQIFNKVSRKFVRLS